MDGVGGLTSAVSAGLLRQAEQGADVAASLLKKAIQSDKNLVATLLPPPVAPNSLLDIRA